MSDINMDMINACRPNGVMFDIGANHGKYTIEMAKKAKIVYAFEPSPENITILREKTIHLPNVRIQEIALSNIKGKTKLMIVSNPGGHSIHASLSGKAWKHNLDNSVDVNVTTLDKFCQENNIDRVDGIKIDVEAHELEVLLGAKETLKKCHPLMAIEIHQTVDLKAIVNILCDCDYDVPALKFDRGYFLK